MSLFEQEETKDDIILDALKTIIILLLEIKEEIKKDEK